jgi:hypothetical protein
MERLERPPSCVSSVPTASGSVRGGCWRIGGDCDAWVRAEGSPREWRDERPASAWDSRPGQGASGTLHEPADPVSLQVRGRSRKRSQRHPCGIGVRRRGEDAKAPLKQSGSLTWRRTMAYHARYDERLTVAIPRNRCIQWRSRNPSPLMAPMSRSIRAPIVRDGTTGLESSLRRRQAGAMGLSGPCRPKIDARECATRGSSGVRQDAGGGMRPTQAGRRVSAVRRPGPILARMQSTQMELSGSASIPATKERGGPSTTGCRPFRHSGIRVTETMTRRPRSPD